MLTAKDLYESGVGLGHVLASIGSDIVVCSTNAKQAVGSDPWLIAAGSGSYHSLVRPIIPSRKSQYLELYMVGRATGDAITQALKMKVFGQVPFKRETRDSKTVWPNSVDSNFTDVSRFYKPLVLADGTVEATFGTSYVQTYGSGWGLIGPVIFNVAGSDLLIPHVTQAVVGPTAALVIAQLVS